MRNKIAGYFSSYDRGLDILLFHIWPKVKEKHPDAELHVAYGWDLFKTAYANNPERQEWMERMNKQMKALDVKHYGRLSKDKLKALQEHCGLWVYPCYFTGEIHCITALDTQRAGMVPVATDDFGLSHTVGSGKKIKGDVYDEEVQEEFVKQTLRLMEDEQDWEAESKKAKKFAKGNSWENMAERWEDVFQS